MYRVANAGLAYDFQLINVEDFNGVGESEPSPYFYQVRLSIFTMSLVFCFHFKNNYFNGTEMQAINLFKKSYLNITGPIKYF